ncbi:MAG: hypothetical protein ACREP6_08290 [Candidatus Binataceae bacterium]
MGAFLLGIIIGIAITIALFMYDEGEIFLKLSRQIKLVMARYKEPQRTG